MPVFGLQEQRKPARRASAFLDVLTSLPDSTRSPAIQIPAESRRTVSDDSASGRIDQM